MYTYKPYFLYRYIALSLSIVNDNNIILYYVCERKTNTQVVSQHTCVYNAQKGEIELERTTIFII